VPKGCSLRRPFSELWSTYACSLALKCEVVALYSSPH
jgi:hypothetical protein